MIIMMEINMKMMNIKIIKMKVKSQEQIFILKIGALNMDQELEIILHLHMVG